MASENFLYRELEIYIGLKNYLESKHSFCNCKITGGSPQTMDARKSDDLNNHENGTNEANTPTRPLLPLRERDRNYRIHNVLAGQGAGVIKERNERAGRSGENKVRAVKGQNKVEKGPEVCLGDLFSSRTSRE
jgi:hypothetical protein